MDDRSEDDTAALARAIAERDPRVRVIQTPTLQSGWFGKQWACENGAMAASGSVLLFADADTAHGPELVPRAVNAMFARKLDFLTRVRPPGTAQLLGARGAAAHLRDVRDALRRHRRGEPLEAGAGQDRERAVHLHHAARVRGGGAATRA